MITETTEGLTISDLEIQKFGLEDRIRRLEADLRAPLEADFSEQAGQISHQMLLTRLLEVERNNLRKINFELEKKKQAY